MKSINTDLGILILRITVGGLMIFHGVAKLVHGHGFIIAALSQKGLPEILWLGVPLAEFIAPILIILGLFTRVASSLIVFTMIMTFYLVFGMDGFKLNEYGTFVAELNLFYMFTAIAIYFTGSGRFALSEILFKNQLKLKSL
ncbi:DoxX family protein [Ancylomarina salipaludis]|uniref:DoxX family protein n=1 Tax=Ancylomarina salipaludis TaxID=2501299 RepID=A0A4Q1JJJ2_9BACT|nr:DoxX family protein [Ancylomarina salipaludis]RXQ91500.1 DoxX family protein [Ancylomarina salipaludis]